MILYLNHKNKKTVFHFKNVFPNVCKHYLIIYDCLKFTFKKVGRMLIITRKFYFKYFWPHCVCWSPLYPRYLGDLYNHGTVH